MHRSSPRAATAVAAPLPRRPPTPTGGSARRWARRKPLRPAWRTAAGSPPRPVPAGSVAPTALAPAAPWSSSTATSRSSISRPLTISRSPSMSTPMTSSTRCTSTASPPASRPEADSGAPATSSTSCSTPPTAPSPGLWAPTPSASRCATVAPVRWVCSSCRRPATRTATG